MLTAHCLCCAGQYPDNAAHFNTVSLQVRQLERQKGVLARAGYWTMYNDKQQAGACMASSTWVQKNFLQSLLMGAVIVGHIDAAKCSAWDNVQVARLLHCGFAKAIADVLKPWLLNCSTACDLFPSKWTWGHGVTRGGQCGNGPSTDSCKRTE